MKVRTESNHTKWRPAFTLLVLALLAAPAVAGVETYVRSSALEYNPAKFRAKRAPTSLAMTPIQKNFDPSTSESLTVFCNAYAYVNATDGYQGVKRVKAKWSAMLLVINEGVGTVQSIDLGAGTFTTDENGRAHWRVTVETADFAEGFPESISAMVQTETVFRNGKRVNGLTFSCGTP